MSKLAERLIQNSTIADTSLINESIFYTQKDMIMTSIPMLNVALSGRVDGGLTPGLTVIAGPSKHFKSLLSLIMAAAYMKKYPESVLLLYLSEFGMPEGYLKALDIDMSRVVVTPLTDIEKLKFDIAKQLDDITREDKVIIIVDSVGNLASKKEAADALEANSKADMTRAKELKSLFRIVTPYLTIKDIPMVVVNHTYEELALYPRQIVSGGTGIYLSADTIWIMGRKQDAVGQGVKKVIEGYNFIINVEKSRYVKEKSKIPINVTWEGGIQKWSGMLDIALEAGVVEQVGRSVVFQKKKYTIDSIENDDDFWTQTVFPNSNIYKYITNKYMLVADKSIMPKYVGEEETITE